MKLCECGCGLPAPIATKTDNSRGYVKGEPRRYILGHRKHTAETKQRMSETRRGDQHARWQGGRRIREDGYVLLSCKGNPNADAQGKALEHRVVMSDRIGRPLSPAEHVHHVNGVRDDNRPENLWLFPNAGAHRVWHAFDGELVVELPAVSVA